MRTRLAVFRDILNCLDELLPQFDLTAHKCDKCGLTVRNNVGDYAVWQMIKSWRDRTERWIASPNEQGRDKDHTAV